LPDPASGSSARYEAVQVEQAIWEVIHLETILLVDDEPTVLNLCQRILRVGGYNVIAAESGVDALRRMQNSAQTIDLALLDLMMPGMNGIELARHVQNGNPGVPILLMTGYGPEEIARVVRDNPYRIIWKPFKTESLLRMIENALGGSTSGTV
jgi:two-component system, cell cycle sensor histidine kinase and response regulator CckA